MPNAIPPSVLLQFQGRRDYPLEKHNDDWGLTPAQQESYVEQFRRTLAAKEAWKEEHHDYFVLRRFLRARTYDLDKATLMWVNHLKWQDDFKVENILTEFLFEERNPFIEAYPQGYHKIDKLGRPVYIQVLGKINMAAIKKCTTEERMLKFHIQEYERCRKVILPICSRLAGRHLDQTFGIMDVKGVGLSHLTGEVKRLMQLVMQYDQDNYPEMLGHICIINAPAIFRMLWSVVKNYIDIRTQQKIEILGVDYKGGLLKWVDAENLPKWLGGTSDGSLADDCGPWHDSHVLAQLGMDVKDLSRRHLPPPPPPGLISTESFKRLSESIPQPSLHHGVKADGPSHSANGSEGGSFRSMASANGETTGSKRFHGITEEVERAMSAGHGITAIHELGGPRLDAKPSKTLVDRIAALEKLFPPHMERLRANLDEGNGDSVISGGVSTQSAPTGSLLNRVEVLEESMAALLAAQEASLEYQQNILSRVEENKEEGACCCAVM